MLTMHFLLVLDVCPAVGTAAEIGCLAGVQPKAVIRHLVVEVLQLILKPQGGVAVLQVIRID